MHSAELSPRLQGNYPSDQHHLCGPGTVPAFKKITENIKHTEVCFFCAQLAKKRRNAACAQINRFIVVPWDALGF